jgi:chloride channel protein, CIC family
VSLGAILGGTMRSPLTGILFAIELTHDFNMLLPLLVACFAAHAFTVLVLRRSILTEKVSRRGYHLSREYSVDPLETLLVQDVMRTATAGQPIPVTEVAHPDESLRAVVYRMAASGVTRMSVVDRATRKRRLGVITLEDLLTARTRNLHEERTRERVLGVKLLGQS